MFKALGFIIGSAVTVAGILLVLGKPDFHLSTFEADQARFDAAMEKIKERVPELPQQPELQETHAEVVDTSTTEGAMTQAVAVAPDPGNFAAEPDSEIDELFADVLHAEQQWHEFWNPFRSEIAARGFVTQLERVTGLDYRIVKIEAGIYQVGFAYQNDQERLQKIALISTATGLELPET